MGLTPVPDDHLAAVVTTLEMHARPRPRALPASPLRLARWDAPEPERYRELFRRVGGPWLWFSRLLLDDAALVAITRRPETQVHAVIDSRRIEVGLLELTHHADDWCMIDYFGLVPELIGAGHGRWLMGMAMAMAWTPTTRFVRVNTCTLDHPKALGFYQAQGFAAVGRTVETFRDPRLTGALPVDTAPQVPLVKRR